jgi:hypothetical protein
MSTALDPKVEALANSLESLQLGAKKACIAFAEVLYQEGVVRIADLAMVSESDARDALMRAGMSKIQQSKVMQALAPAPAPAPAPPSAEAKASSPPFINSALQLQLRFPHSLVF